MLFRSALIANTYFEGKYNPEEVLALGLLHEAGEVITGDLPTPIKYFNPEIRRAYDQVEQALLGKRVFCGYGRPKQESDKGVHTEPVGGGQNV